MVQLGMAKPDTKHRFKSFAAPSEDDGAAFDALPADEQKALIEDEVAKGFEGEPIAVTKSTSQEIMSRVLKRAAGTHADC